LRTAISGVDSGLWRGAVPQSGIKTYTRSLNRRMIKKPDKIKPKNQNDVFDFSPYQSPPESG
jgi:hypothetical protein